MYTGHISRSDHTSAAASTTTQTPDAAQPTSAGPSAYDSATVAVAVVVAFLLLMAVTAVAVTEHRKKKAVDAPRPRVNGRDGEGLARWETRESLGSFDSTAGLKEPQPAARGALHGRRFLLLFSRK